MKGFIVGNGATDWNYDADIAYPEVFANFNVIPVSLYDQYIEFDCKSYWGDVQKVKNAPECEAINTQIETLTKDLNIYDMFRKKYDVKLGGAILEQPKVDRIGKVMVHGEEKTYTRGYTAKEYTPWAKMLKSMPEENLKVSGDFVSDYVNSQELRDALHIPTAMPGWHNCNNNVTNNYFTYLEGSIWIYPILKAYGYKMMHYSGDTDGAVPTIGTRRWIDKLNFDITNGWRQWIIDGNVAGFIIDYANFVFVTVHGVGHMAPQWKRKEVTQLITNYIHDKPIA